MEQEIMGESGNQIESEEFQMKKKAGVFVLYGLLFLGLAGCQQRPEEKAVSAPAISEKPQETPLYVAENKKYNLSLPDAETFGQELKDFIYWETATMIEKDVHGLKYTLAKQQLLL